MNSLVRPPFRSASSLSVLCIPTDVLQHHIFPELDIASLVVCALTCSQFRRLSSKQQMELPKDKRSQNNNLQVIFRNGWTNLLSWFQARLRYPSMAELDELRPVLLEKCLSLAAEGYCFNRSILFFYLLLMI